MSSSNAKLTFSRQLTAHGANDMTDSEESRPTTPGSDRHHPLGRRRSSASSVSSTFFELDLTAPTPVEHREDGIRLPSSSTLPTIAQKTRIRILKARDYYTYNSLPKDQVRLLVIEPGAPDDPINVTLSIVADRDLGTKTWPYQALSYHWGQGEEEKEIYIRDNISTHSLEPPKSLADAVNGARLLNGMKDKRKKKLIKPNLHEALKHLRHKTKPYPVWVDALCIDQSNDIEKTEQVCKMARIYRKAGSVCIWLGYDEADSSSSTAMKFIPEVINPDKYEELLEDESKIAHWASLFELLKWSWFSRRWIIQELALARKATVHCGDNIPVHWKDFQDAIAIFCANFETLKPRLRLHLQRTGRHKRNRWNNDSAFEIDQLGAKLLVEITFNLFRKNRDGTIESTYSLETLVCRLSGFETSDPRDTINALISISSEIDRTKTTSAYIVPAPDYSKDLFQVYRDFVKYVVATSHSLDIVCRHWALPGSAKDACQLPSWIQFADDSAFGRGHGVFQGRKAGVSFVGLPDRSQYHASGRGHLRRLPEVRWPQEPAPAAIQRGGEEVAQQSQPAPIHNVSLHATGLIVGRVSFRTDPFPDGIITRPCLEGLGWSFGTDCVPEQLYQTLVADRGPNCTPMQTLYRRACQHVMVNLTNNYHINIDNLLREHTGYIKAYLERVRAVTWNRLFIEATPLPSEASGSPIDTAEKLVGLGPPKTEKDDIIAILYGCSVPVIIRPIYDSDNRLEGHQFVGEAFVYGKMDGEALHGRFEEHEFRLI
ncbi:hypothetical protein E8E11_007207 [Didymella keratinophila]|nr:hypothetical protein E8E11_007207 [Didymella keratinophila]